MSQIDKTCMKSLPYDRFMNHTNKLRTLLNIWDKNVHIKPIFFLAFPLQAPLVHKWNEDMSRAKRRTPMDIQNNT